MLIVQLFAWRMDPETENAAAAALEQISRYCMPFGMFGPKHYPPKGVPIYDLPAEVNRDASVAARARAGQSMRQAGSPQGHVRLEA